MSNLNKIVLVGSAAEEPSQKTIGDGTTVANFPLAVQRQKRPDGTPSETDFIDIVSFGRIADTAKESVKKGSFVLVEGRIQVRTYDDSNGQRKYVTEVVASNLLKIQNTESVGSASPAQETVPATEFSAESAKPVEDDVPF